MRLRDMLLTSALSGSLALYPLALHAQNFDTWTLGREVLNSAANYTGVLTTAHREVQKYITWDWSTSLDEDAQQTRTDALLAEITDSQQINAELVPSLDMTVLDSYDVRFRYCDNMLLSYFASAGFKQGLSPQQIVAAPVLRARRAGTTFYGEPLGIVASDGGELMLQTSDRSQAIPACMGDGYGGALAEGTVAYMTAAAQKFGVARTRKHRETRKLPCAGRQVGPGIKQQRFESTDYNAQGDPLYNAQSTIPYDPEDAVFDFSYFDTATAEGDGHWHWKTKYTHCRAPATISVRRVEACPGAAAGTALAATYEYFLTEAYDPGFAGTDDFAKTIWLPSDRAGAFLDAPVGHLVAHLSFCEDPAGPRVRDPEISTTTENRAGVCRAEYPRYPLGTVTEARTVTIRRWSFADSPDVEDIPALSDIVIERDGSWAIDDDSCYRRVNVRSPETKVSSCPSGQTGSVSYRRVKTVAGEDYHSATLRDQLTTTHTRWTATANTCRYVPPPPPPPTPAGCTWTGSEKGWDACQNRLRQSRNSGGGGGRGGNNRDSGSVDVDGDGYGDFKDHDSRGFGGTSVSSGCGGCNGPAGGGRPGERGKDGRSGGDGGGGGKGRVICTELWRQGLVSRELAVMDLRFTAEHLTPTHYRGYHAWAIPVVHKMRHSARWTAVWKVLAVARMNEIAWQLGKADRPDYLGKIVRHTLEPLSYLIGLFVDESDIAALYRTERNRKEISHV